MSHLEIRKWKDTSEKVIGFENPYCQTYDVTRLILNIREILRIYLCALGVPHFLFIILYIYRIEEMGYNANMECVSISIRHSQIERYFLRS